MRIEVNENDLAMGKRSDPEHCPVARAVERETGQPTQVVYKENDYFLITIKVGSKEIDAPDEVCYFVEAFDDPTSYEMKPFGFDLPDFDAPGWMPVA